MLSLQAERAILALALAWPTWGPVQLSDQLRRPEHGSLRIAPCTIYRLLRRMGLQTRWERLAVLEAHSAQAFVERLQGTILSELWRIGFRRRYFTSVAVLQIALDRYLEFYSTQRSHQGYRTRGRTPGEIFHTRGGKRDRRTRKQSVNTYPV